MDRSVLSSWLPRAGDRFLGEGRKELKPTTGKGERGYRGVGVNSDGKFGR